MYLADMFTAGPNELDNIDNMARSFNQPLTTITHQTLVFGGHISKMVNLNWRHQGHPPICRVFFNSFFLLILPSLKLRYPLKIGDSYWKPIIFRGYMLVSGSVWMMNICPNLVWKPSRSCLYVRSQSTRSNFNEGFFPGDLAHQNGIGELQKWIR